MTYLLKLLLYCAFLTTLNIRALKAEQSFEDAELVNEFITMSFSSSHPYDLRQTIPGEPEIDYPIYSEVPRTDFDCNGRHEGYYADVETRCQVFRICANTDLVGRGFAFLCPNGTLFSQKNFVCDWYRNVDCNNSERFYSKNDNNRIGTKTDMMKTVRQMMEHPMKTINVVLNRGKATTPKPTTYFSRGTSTTKAPKNFRTSSTPANRLPAQDTNLVRQPITLDQVETASRFGSPLQHIYPTQQTDLLVSSPSDGGFRPSNVSTLTLTPPSPTFTPPFETLPSSAPYADESPISSDNNAPYETYPSSNTNAGSPLLPTEDSTNEKDVYVSSLGELSTDPGANFNRQTSRIIADQPSNSLETVSKPSNASGMNFAEKVNAGLNGQQILNRGEVIAPEYVKNIVQQNIPVPNNVIQPPSFDFASNINSLLDEINYEAELGGTNSLQYQQQTAAKEAASATTKKPFRFLSRGFSHENPKTNGPYAYRQATSAPRNTYKAQQDSSSTQSYRNSFLTTSLTTTRAPLTLLETTQTSALDTNSADSKIEHVSKLNPKSEASLSQTHQGGVIIKEDKKSSLSETSQIDKTVESQSVEKAEVELELKSNAKPALKREQKDLKQQESDNPLNELPQELDGESKANANKRAEDLLLAGVKQITVNDLTDKGKANDEEDPSRIVPIYNRATGPETSTPHLTSSSTVSATSPTTTPKTTSTPLPSSTTNTANTFSSTFTSLASSTTPEPSTTPAVSIRRFTVGSGNRRQTSRPITYSKRNNLSRSGTRTSTTTTKAPTTTSPTFRGRSGRRTTSTTTGPSSTKITPSPRRRLNANRFTYGSRRKTTESIISTLSSSSSTTTTTTTVAPPSKKISVRSSDSSLSDLTAVASTYNAAPNRAYNSIRQGSYKYTQTQRRRPSHRNNTSATTTTKSPAKIPTTQQPRSSSSYPTPTLNPFSHPEIISPMPFSSTTPEPLPATFLSFNDLTKSITDDSILQTLRKNQDFSRQLIEPKAFRSQQQASPIQQIPFSTAPRIQQGVSTQRPPLPIATTLPFIPLKDFIASKFGSQYSPEPPKLSTARPVLITSGVNNGFSLQAQKNQVLEQQYTKQQFGIRQEYVPHAQANHAIKPLGLSPGNQNLFQQQAQVNNQQQQQQFQQQQYQQQLRLQQQQEQKLQQLKQQQNQLAQQYQIQQQQKLQQQQQQIQQQQKVQQQQQQKLQQQQLMQQQQQKLLQQQEQIHQQQKQVSPPQYFTTKQQQIFPNQQYSQQQFNHALPTVQQQQQQQIQRNSAQQVSTKIVPSVEQQFQIQRSQQIQQPIAQPQPQQQFQQRQQQSQIQIIPSQMTVAQTIPPQHSNINFNSNVQPEIGSINVRLPSNVAALIPNTNLFDSRVNGNSIERAQRRSDQSFEDAYGARERKSVYAGVSSYDVPLSSVGRLANDITNFLRQRRL